MTSYPKWFWYPSNSSPPEWVEALATVFKNCQNNIDSSKNSLNSDEVLKELSEGLEEIGFAVEKGKKKEELIRRPVLYGEQGNPRVTYELDAFHDDIGIVFEVEAGRAMSGGNAVYRNLIRTSLILGAKYLVIGVRETYGKEQTYDKAHDQIDAIYASGRLQLPFEGIL